MVEIAFFGHNLNDAAIHRRAVAFQRAGHSVTGFMARRGDARPAPFPAIDLGSTRDNAYSQRVRSIFNGAKLAASHKVALSRADLIYARNLDMLAVAVRALKHLGLSTPLVYECLDIHQKLTGNGTVARGLRRLERRLLRRCDRIVISSPRFDTEHFAHYYPSQIECTLIENRLIEGDEFAPRPLAPRTRVSGKLRIGWYGNLRCRKSLDLLKGLAKSFPDAIQISLRGYPAPGVFPDFAADIADVSNISFGGRYKAPEDLAEIYNDVDLVWAGDWYEEGANSVWLLPNRIYEGGYFATPALAPVGTQTAQWLSNNACGLLIEPPFADALKHRIEILLADPAEISALEERLIALPRQTFVEDVSTTQNMLKQLNLI